MRPIFSFVLTFIISLAANYIIISTGYWYLEIISGVVFSALFCRSTALGFISTLLSGIFAALIYVYPLIQIGAMNILNVTGKIAGINGSILFAIMLLISGLLPASGALIAIPLKIQFYKKQK
ncbi:MAG: hypothetical protein ACP5FU_04630 [Nitrososphaeria archaeon]